jgi:hypothetical protein
MTLLIHVVLSGLLIDALTGPKIWCIKDKIRSSSSFNIAKF